MFFLYISPDADDLCASSIDNQILFFFLYSCQSGKTLIRNLSQENGSDAGVLDNLADVLI